ncbi:MAG: hypothetical protein ACLS5R_11865 [Blautia sp.]
MCGKSCYGKIGGVWFDGNWSKPEEDWELDELYGVIRKYQPEPFLYGHGRTARVAKIQCEKLQNVRTIYES